MADIRIIPTGHPKLGQMLSEFRVAVWYNSHKSLKKLPESEKGSQNNVRYIKILPKWGRIHEDGIKIMSDTSLKSPKQATCSNNTHICNVF